MSFSGSIGVLITLFVIFFALFIVYLIVKIALQEGRSGRSADRVRPAQAAWQEGAGRHREGRRRVLPHHPRRRYVRLARVGELRAPVPEDDDARHRSASRLHGPGHPDQRQGGRAGQDPRRHRAHPQRGRRASSAPAEDVQSTIKETVAGHLRGIIGTLTIEELYRDQKRFQDSVRNEAHTDLEGMGFEFRSFVFREIQDDEGYLNALGQPKIQEALKQARIATAEADRDAKHRGGGRPPAEGAAAARGRHGDREADRDLEMKKAVDQARRRRGQRPGREGRRNGAQGPEHQDRGPRGRAPESWSSNATIREQADAKKYETERLADAEQYRVERQASAVRKRREEAAKALKAEGLANAEAESDQRRDIGLAEAEAIQAKGEAEAKARGSARRGVEAVQRGGPFDRGAQGAAPKSRPPYPSRSRARARRRSSATAAPGKGPAPVRHEDDRGRRPGARPAASDHAAARRRGPIQSSCRTLQVTGAVGRNPGASWALRRTLTRRRSRPCPSQTNCC